MRQSTIDWTQVHERLRATHARLEEAFAPNADRIEEAYRRRAVRLARQGLERAQSSPALPAMIVRLAGERYAIELKSVAEVLPHSECTPVPGAPEEFLGVIGVRGELRPVLDLRTVLALPAREDGEPGFVLMLRHSDGEIGVKVDRVEELREIRAEDLARPIEGNYLKGLAPGTLMLLDTDAMLAAIFSKEES